MSKKTKWFLGHELGRGDTRAVASLINYTSLCIGIPKKRIRSEEQLWGIVHSMFGMRPYPGEGFMVAVRRIRNAIARLPSEQRAQARYIARCAAEGNPPIVHTSPPESAKNEWGDEVAENALKRKPSATKRTEFYLTWEWRRMRMEVLKEYGRRCMCCGAQPTDTAMHGGKVRIVVDHIKPVSKFWHLRLDRSNLQVLCDECNQGKGAWDETDWREGGLDQTQQTDPLTAEYRSIFAGGLIQ